MYYKAEYLSLLMLTMQSLYDQLCLGNKCQNTTILNTLHANLHMWTFQPKWQTYDSHDVFCSKYLENHYLQKYHAIFVEQLAM